MAPNMPPNVPPQRAPGGPRPAGPREGELPLDLGDRLPWLEADDEIEREAGSGRVVAALVALVLLLGIGGGGFWYFRHKQAEEAMAVAGGVIKAPPGPYKTRPADPGGTVAQGTGDSAFKVAQGKKLSAPLAASGGGVDVAGPQAVASGPAGIGVQLGAYSDQDEAEKAWPGLEARFPLLSGLHHRVVQMPGDLGTVYGLQAVTANDAAATTLCGQLRASGLRCQVRD